jgi:hypothetical protein
MAADAAGYRRYIAVGESQTTVAALWAALDGGGGGGGGGGGDVGGAGWAPAATAVDAGSSLGGGGRSGGAGGASSSLSDGRGGSGSGGIASRIAGLVLTLVPTAGEHRAATFNATAAKIKQQYGSLENAMHKIKVRRCRLTVPKPTLNAPMVLAHETIMSSTAFRLYFQFQHPPLHQGGLLARVRVHLVRQVPG